MIPNFCVQISELVFYTSTGHWWSKRHFREHSCWSINGHETNHKGENRTHHHFQKGNGIAIQISTEVSFIARYSVHVRNHLARHSTWTHLMHPEPYTTNWSHSQQCNSRQTLVLIRGLWMYQDQADCRPQVTGIYSQSEMAKDKSQ